MAAEIAEKIEGDLHRVFQERIPSAAAIAERAVKTALAGREQDGSWIKSNFSALVQAVHDAACGEYQEAQQEAARAAFCAVLLPLAGEDATPADFIRMLGDNFYVLDRFFVGLTHTRRPHAAKAFELLICKFLAVHYAGAAQAVLPGQPDFILPSIDQLRRNPADTIIFSVKKSVRDRWRQMLTEATRPSAYFLATTDEEIAPGDLSQMQTADVHLVVPAPVKSVRSDYETAPNVVTFEDFFAFHLDPAVERWRAAGIVRTPPPVSKPADVFAGAAQPDALPPGFTANRSPGSLRHRTTPNLLQANLFD